MADLFVSLMYAILGAHIVLCVLSIREAIRPPIIRRRDYPGPPDPAPLVSILIPARDEEHNIRDCLRTLASQDYPNFEIIVVDDRSRDDTGRIVEEFARDHPFIRLVKGRELPEGWLGKSHACHQAFQEARGEWLLFVDADTRHSPESLTQTMNYVLGNRVDMLSLYPHFEALTFWEKVIMPAVGRMLLIGAPFELVNSDRTIFRLFAVAIGQFILISRSAYEATDGHRAVRKVVVEDIEIAKRVKKKGLRLRFLYGIDILSTRMYARFSDLWRGWSRSFYGGMGNNLPQALLSTLLLFIFGCLPYLTLPAAVGLLLLGVRSEALVEVFRLCSLQWALILPTTYIVRRRLREYPECSWTFPLGGIMVQWIAVHSLYQHTLARNFIWKGRNLK